MIQFINELANEVQKRLKALDLKGRSITLKVKGSTFYRVSVCLSVCLSVVPNEILYL